MCRHIRNFGGHEYDSGDIDRLADFRHDREHTGRSEFNADPNHRAPKWRFTFPQAKAFSDPVIDSKGTIYTSAFEYDPGKNSNSTHLFALNPDGTKKWAFGTTGLINAEWGASPAIGADGTIYVAGKETNSHSSTSLKSTCWAINPYGALKWKFSTNGSGVSSPVIGSDGVVYVGSVDLSADGSFGGNLYAITPTALSSGGMQPEVWWTHLRQSVPMVKSMSAPTVLLMLLRLVAWSAGCRQRRLLKDSAQWNLISTQSIATDAQMEGQDGWKCELFPCGRYGGYDLRWR